MPFKKRLSTRTVDKGFVGAKKTREFDGKVYRRWHTTYDKKKAKDYAAHVKQQGGMCRITSEKWPEYAYNYKQDNYVLKGSGTVYVVWVRNPSTTRSVYIQRPHGLVEVKRRRTR